MEIPALKACKNLWEGIKADCLIGTGRNSELPGLAVAHCAECGKDKTFKVVLRGRVRTEWDQQMLKWLFKGGGLLAAIQTGLKLYEASPAFSKDDIDEDVRQEGLLAHVCLNQVILDPSRREVILVLSSIAIGDIDEHGLVVHGLEGSWKMDRLEYVNDFLAEIESVEEAEEAPEFTPIDPSPLFGFWKLAKPVAGMSIKDGLSVNISPESISVSMRGLPIIRSQRWSACEQNGKQLRFRTELCCLTFNWSNGVLGYGDYALKKVG
jgi:hypothetical protein